jgi:hypothetical protein
MLDCAAATHLPSRSSFNMIESTRINAGAVSIQLHDVTTIKGLPFVSQKTDQKPYIEGKIF